MSLHTLLSMTLVVAKPWYHTTLARATPTWPLSAQYLQSLHAEFSSLRRKTNYVWGTGRKQRVNCKNDATYYINYTNYKNKKSSTNLFPYSSTT